MLPASSRPHEDFYINGLREWIEIRPMDLPCHLTVTTQAAVGGRIAVRLGRILRVEGDIRQRHPPLVGQSICLERRAFLATMCIQQGKKQHD